MRSALGVAFKLVAWICAGAVAVAGLVATIGPSARSLATSIDAQSNNLASLSPLTQRSLVYDANGNVIATLYSDEDRSPVDFAQIPPALIDTVLAVEDREFFSHGGVDYRGIGRAVLRDLTQGGAQGGSSITQQLAKNRLFPGGRGRSGKEKIKEAKYAIQLEQKYTKKEILQEYLNTVYFGNGAYGVKVGAERYFHKQMKQLTLPEMALLAGLIAQPVDSDPIKHPAAARRRRAEVFDSLVAVGSITTFDARHYNETPLPKRVYKLASFSANCNYFVLALMEWLTLDGVLAAESLGPDKASRLHRIYHDGLRITTTWDQTIQSKMETAIDSQSVPAELATAVALVDNHTGAVKAFHSQKAELCQENGKVKGNIAVDPNPATGRQPGSQFKVFTLAAAIESGYSPRDYISGSEESFTRPVTTQSSPWKPKTDLSGTMSLRTALAKSVTPAFARLEFSLGNGAIGPKRVADMAHKLGIPETRHLGADSSLTLGVKEVVPLEMATAYATIANDGVRHRPIFATKIAGPDGSVIYDQTASIGEPEIAPEVARTLTDMMQEVVKSGTGTNARLDGNRMVAGKTGTTDNDENVWFTGFTAQYTTSVWIGNPLGNISLDGLLDGPGSGPTYGGKKPAKIFAAFMNLLHADLPNIDFTAPDDTLWPRSSFIDETGRRSHGPQAPYVYAPTPSNTTVAAQPGHGGTGATVPSTPPSSPSTSPGSTPPTKKP